MAHKLSSRQPIHANAVWNAANVGAPDEWTCVLDDATRGAIVDATTAMRARGVTVATATRADVDFDALRPLATAWARDLRHGRGDWDRNDEQPPGDAPFFAMPVLSDVDDRPCFFYIGWYIRDAQRHPDSGLPRTTSPVSTNPSGREPRRVTELARGSPRES